MKHNLPKNFIESLRNIHMTSNEKSDLRNHLLSYALHYKPQKSPYGSFMLFAKRSFAIAFVVILSLATFSNAATKNSLPGDIFYPVKIAHEEIALATTFDTKKKINYEIKRTEKRIQEATVLAQNNDLDTKTKISVAENIKKQTSRVRQHISEIKENNPSVALALNDKLKSTMQINQEALKKVAKIDDADALAKEPLVVDDTPLLKKAGPTPAELTVVKDDDEGSVEAETSLSLLANDNVSEKEKVSFAQSLVESLDAEVKDIEAFENHIEEDIQAANEPGEGTVVITQLPAVEKTSQKKENDGLSDSESKQDKETPGTQSSEPNRETVLENNLVTLQDIITIKEKIAEIKKNPLTMHQHSFVSSEGKEIVFDESELRQKADVYLSEERYQEALEIFKNILDHFLEDQANAADEISKDEELAPRAKKTSVHDTPSIEKNATSLLSVKKIK